jgi:hypothetical protein
VCGVGTLNSVLSQVSGRPVVGHSKPTGAPPYPSKHMLSADASLASDRPSSKITTLVMYATDLYKLDPQCSADNRDH